MLPSRPPPRTSVLPSRVTLIAGPLHVAVPEMRRWGVEGGRETRYRGEREYFSVRSHYGCGKTHRRRLLNGLTLSFKESSRPRRGALDFRTPVQ